MSEQQTCPKCGLEQTGEAECRRCGVVFARYKPRKVGTATDSTTPTSPPPPPVRNRRPALPLVLVLALAAVLLVLMTQEWWARRGAQVARVETVERALTSTSLTASSPEEKAVRTAYEAYRRAFLVGDIGILRSLISEEHQREFGTGGAEMLAMAAAFAPQEVRIVGVKVEGIATTLQVEGTNEGVSMRAEVAMVQEEGIWKLDKEEWTATFEGIPVFVGEGDREPPEIASIDRLKGGKRAHSTGRIKAPALGPGDRPLVRSFYASGDPPPQAERLAGHRGTVSGVAFVPHWPWLVSAGYGDKQLKLWDVSGGELLASAEMNDRPKDLAVSPDGERLYTIDAYNHVLEWLVQDEAIVRGRELGRPPRHNYALALHPKGELLATVGGELGKKGWLHLWDARSGGLRQDAETSLDLRSVAFSPSGRFVAAGDHGRSVTVWDLQEGRARTYSVSRAAENSDVFGVAFSPDGAILATAHMDSSVSLWDLRSGKVLQDFFVRDQSTTAVAFSPDGELFATTHPDGVVRLWSVPERTPLTQLSGSEAPANQLAFRSDGGSLAVAHDDGVVVIWRPAD